MPLEVPNISYATPLAREGTPRVLGEGYDTFCRADHLIERERTSW